MAVAAKEVATAEGWGAVMVVVALVVGSEVGATVAVVMEGVRVEAGRVVEAWVGEATAVALAARDHLNAL
jgi:hypothetical protein